MVRGSRAGPRAPDGEGSSLPCRYSSLVVELSGVLAEASDHVRSVTSHPSCKRCPEMTPGLSDATSSINENHEEHSAFAEGRGVQPVEDNVGERRAPPRTRELIRSQHCTTSR